MKDTTIYREGWIAKPAIHPVVWHFAVACFFGTLLTDIAYWRSAEMMWSNFSAWLLMAGLVLGAVAAIAFFVDWLSGRLVGINAAPWLYVVGNVVALLLSLYNALVHSRDAWASVMPTGLIVSAVVVVVLLVSGWLSRMMVYRRYAGAVK